MMMSDEDEDPYDVLHDLYDVLQDPYDVLYQSIENRKVYLKSGESNYIILQ